MTKEYKMVLVGVGGQGILTISDIIAIAAKKKGMEILGSEVHGMAQKGGSVITNLKIGQDLNSPTIPIGESDVIVGLEQNETLRYMKYIKPGKTVISSKTVLFPIGWKDKKNKDHATQARTKIIDNLNKFDVNLIMVDAESLADKAGLALAQNIVLLGALSQVSDFPLTVDELKEAMKERVPSKFIEPNLKAFDLGINSIK